MYNVRKLHQQRDSDMEGISVLEKLAISMHVKISLKLHQFIVRSSERYSLIEQSLCTEIL